MDRINELLARLSELTPDELNELNELCSTTFDSLDSEPRTPANVAAMADVVAAAESARGEVANRQAAQEAAEADAEALRARMQAVTAGPEDEAGTEGDEGEGAEATGDEAEADATAPEAVAASASAGNRAARMTSVSGRGQARPSPEQVGAGAPRSALVASSDAGSYSGQRIEDFAMLGEVMADRLSRIGSGGRESALVASARWHLPEERQLNGDPWQNTAKILDVTSPEALVATGGICSPVNVDYTVPVWASADRPLKDGLPAFEASRGGVTFVAPPDFTGLASGTAVWTAANDASPSSPTTKPVVVVSCGSPVTATVNAIPTRVQFGNMQSRFAPEQIAANTELAMVAAARIAEVELLTLMLASCKHVSAAQVYGASRDLLATIDKTVASYRDVHRLPDSIKLTVVYPRWARDLFRADLVRELAHDRSGLDIFAVTNEQIDAWFAVRNVKVIWTMDGLPAGGTTATWPTQNFATEPSDSTEVLWPAKVLGLFFVEGTFQFLDGGRLDLGVVRDATLDSTNDYETFVEPFEGIAFRGIEALAIVSAVQPSGGSASSITAVTTGL